MRNIKMIAAIATTMLFTGSVFANNSARDWFHEVVRNAPNDKNSKLMMMILDGKRVFAFCLEPRSTLRYSIHIEDLGSHTATYLQCADKLCKSVKGIGVDKFVVSKNEKGDLVSTPESYQLKMDDGYGVNCDKWADAHLLDCLSFAHCTDVNVTGANHANKLLGKWIKIVYANNQSKFACIPQAYGNIPLPDEFIESSHPKLGQKVVDTYFQCKNEQACRTGRTEKEIKELGKDIYTLNRLVWGYGYTSDPLMGKIEMDSTFGENCKVGYHPAPADDNAALKDFTMSKATKKMYVLKNNKIQLVKDNKMQVIKGNKMEPVKK